MNVRKIVVWAVLVPLAALSLTGMGPVPRKAPELTFALPSGQPAALSGYKGKVVVIEFMLTHCPHCWRVAQTLNKVDKELAAEGLQTLGVTFDNDIDGKAVSDFVAKAEVGFPVGYSTAEKVDDFLGRGAVERVQVPQVVVIDRTGTIRAQSQATGETNLEGEVYLRNLVVRLLTEKAPG
jgi:peroxiredoxin